MQKLTFEIDSMDIKEQIENSQFVRARVKAFASGQNAHGVPVLESALTKAEKTIYQKPLVWKYNKITDDAMGHELEEVSCGFVPSQGANISYERAEDGRLFFYCDVLIWRFYSGKILEVFEKTDGKKSVSVEIIVTEMSKDGDEEYISDFCYLCITVLGEKYTPAIKDAEAEILQFSVDKSIVEDILQQSFSNTLLQEEEVEQVGFDKNEFVQSFSMTASEVWNMLSDACRESKYQEEGEDYQYTRFYMRDYDGTYIYAYDYKDDKTCAIPYSISEGKAVVDFDNVKPAKQTWVVTEQEEVNPSLMSFAKEILTKDFEDLNNKITSFQDQVTTLENEKTEMEQKFSTLETEKEELVAKFSEVEALKAENTTLLEFKANVEETERKNKIEFAINSVSEDLTPEQVEEWRNKSVDFSTVEEFGNAIKAFAYENSKGKKKDNDVITMSIPVNPIDDKKAKSLWERI